MNEFIEFEYMGTTASGKTKAWMIKSRRTGTMLGEVKWFGRWRRYAFFPCQDTIWNPDCLVAVTDFIAEQMNARHMLSLETT